MGRNLLMIVGLAVAIGLGLWLLGPSGAEPAPIGPAGGSGGALDPTSVPETPAALEAGSEAAEPRETSALAPPPALQVPRFQLVEAITGAPVAGIHAFLGKQTIAGPSDASGWLEFTPPPGQRTTFWAAGWTPRQLHSRDLTGGRIELVRADANLVVLVDGLAPEEGILHHQLEPMGWSTTADCAWSAALQRETPFRLAGHALAPGRYQLYVWIGAFGDGGIALEPVELELTAGEETVVHVDASVRPSDEVDD